MNRAMTDAPDHPAGPKGAVGQEIQQMVAAARAHLQAGESAAAGAIFAGLARRFPANPHWRAALARIAAAEGDWPAVLRELDAIEAPEAGDIADLPRLRGRALMALGRLEEAEPILRAAIAAAPGDAQLRAALARIAASREEWPAVLQELDAAEPAEGAAMADLLRLRVRALMALGRLEEAVPALRAAVEAAPSDPQPRIALANLLRLLGRAGEGAAVLDAMADRPEVRRARIQLLLVAQRAPEARALFPEVAADAATPEDVAWLIRLAARLHGAGTGYEAACRLLRDRLEAIGAETPAARLAAARLHFALGQLPAFRAAAAASLAAGVDEESARVLEALLRATATPSAPQGRRRVFVVGLSKTGTTSVATALGRLGWLAQHWVHPLTGNLLTAEDAVTFDAMADTPVADAAEELAASWPDALFILTRRPVASWVRSWEGHFRRANAVDGLEGMRALVARPELCEHGPRFAALFQRLYTRHPDLPTAFAAHDARIRALFADQPNRLLEFDLVSGDGWEKLCGFLGVPVPAGPFPRENARPDAAR